MLCALSACDQRNKQYRKAIIGKWTFVKQSRKNLKIGEDIYQMSSESNLINGFNLINDSICESNRPFFGDKIQPESGKSIYLFLGYKAKYRIQNDSLEILYPGVKQWARKKIVMLDSANLELLNIASTSINYTKA